MECKYAYTKKNVPYVLCGKEPEPNEADKKELFHACCSHQALCPRANCHKLTASWIRCIKLAERNQASYDRVFDEPREAEAETAKTRSRSRKKPQSES